MALMMIKKLGDDLVVEGKIGVDNVNCEGIVVKFDPIAADEEGEYFYIFPRRGVSNGLRLPIEKIEAAFDEVISQMWDGAHVCEVVWDFAEQRVSQNGFV